MPRARVKTCDWRGQTCQEGCTKGVTEASRKRHTPGVTVQWTAVLRFTPRVTADTGTSEQLFIY